MSSSYTVPSIPTLLNVSSFLYLLNLAESLSNVLTNTHLLGSLVLGILFGPQVFNLLSPASFDVLPTFTLLGYIGLLLLIFEAGLTTNLSLLFAPSNLFLSIVVAITGIAVPIAFSFLLLQVGYGYTSMQAFAAGAALCSTSLGTTVALLTEELRQMRVGAVLMSAALLDDVVGLVIAGIIPNLSETEDEAGHGSPTGNLIHWSTIARPILVSFAFAFLTPVLAIGFRRFVIPFTSARSRRLKLAWKRTRDTQTMRFFNGLRFKITRDHFQLFLIIATLSAFVAGSHYAGTSELFGAYLAGAFLSFTSAPDVEGSLQMAVPSTDDRRELEIICVSPRSHRNSGELRPKSKKRIDEDSGVNYVSSPTSPSNSSLDATAQSHTIHQTFTTYLTPLLYLFLSPLFFASIGASLPVQNLFSIRGKSTVVWRGILYSLLMVLAKAVVGLWVVVWPEPQSASGKGHSQGEVELEDGVDGVTERARSEMAVDEGTRVGARSVNAIGENGTSEVDNRGFEEENNPKPAPLNATLPPSAFLHSPTKQAATPTESNAILSTPYLEDLPKHLHDQRLTKTDNSPRPQVSQRTQRLRSSLLLGSAMVARGEIALIVAQFARPLLVPPGGNGADPNEEPFAVVIWAILVTTFAGAVGVGWVLRRWWPDGHRIG